MTSPISSIFPQVEELHPVGPVGALDGLVDLLRRERVALARMDKKELQSIADGGAPLLDSLRSFFNGDGPNSLSGEERDRFTAAVRRLATEAHVNQLLLHDARTVLSEILAGEVAPAGTYNARGQLSGAVRNIARKTV